MDNIIKIDVKYRKANENDIESIVSLLSTTISTHFYYTSTTRLKSMLDNTFVAEHNNKLIGAAAIGLLGDTIIGIDSRDIDYEVAYIAIEECYRNNGISSKILKLCVESMPDNTVIACEAIGFYKENRANAASALENNGFCLCKSVKDYYKNSKETIEDGCKLCTMNNTDFCKKCSAYLYIK